MSNAVYDAVIYVLTWFGYIALSILVKLGVFNGHRHKKS